MFDLGRTFLAAVERSPDATAISDGKRRLSYVSWYEEIGRVAGGLTALGFRRGDRLAVILHNRLEMASEHWACQFAGIVVTPLNWRIKPKELDYCLAWNIAAPARCRTPVIAASRGYCFGVGFELALACDFRIVSETCLYSLPEQRLGQIPGSGGAARLQKMVGITRAKDIVMRSRHIPGRQAYEWGIATECVADAELDAATDRFVDELCGFPPLAQRTAKKLLNDIEDAILSLAIELEGQAYGRLRGSDDFREGVEAFHQKRRPKFTGR